MNSEEVKLLIDLEGRDVSFLNETIWNCKLNTENVTDLDIEQYRKQYNIEY